MKSPKTLLRQSVCMGFIHGSYTGTVLAGFICLLPVVGRTKKIANFMCQILGDSLLFDHFWRVKFAVYLVAVG